MTDLDAKRVIYTYWENVNGKSMPCYLQMCLETWRKFIPNLQLVVINKRNVHDFIGDDIDLDDFKKLSLAQQSDVVSVALLYKREGVFMDVDTIITGDVSNFIFDDGKLFSSFGFEQRNRIHLAVMWCHKKGNPVLGEWYKTICHKLKNVPAQPNWDFVGNSIINGILDSEHSNGHYKIIDRTQSGNIMESVYDKNEDAYVAYVRFWFGDNKLDIGDVIESAKSKIISLHNSWTPDIYRNASVHQVATAKCTLSRLLCHLLK